MIIPWEFQAKAEGALWDYFRERDGNPLVVMPTGTGKSVVIGTFVRNALAAFPQTRIVVLTHVETLIAQNHAKLMAVWPSAPAGIYSAGLSRRDTVHQIIFAGIQSVYDKPGVLGAADLVLIDEAHLVSPADETMYRAFVAAAEERNPKVKFVGFTATDWRLGSGKLAGNGIFTDVAIDQTTPEAWNYFVDEGYLSRLHSKKTVLQLSDAGIAISGGEYSMRGQQDALDRESLTRQAIEELLWWGNTEQRNCWMIFATGVQHCEHVAELLQDYGVSAVPIHSRMKDAARRIEDFKAGRYRAAVSMNKLTTGVDVPQIDLMGVLRFTKSSALWVQMLGRGTRMAYAPGFDLSTREGRFAAMAAGPKPNGCRVCDFAHNTERLGPINAPVVSMPRGPKRAGQGAPVRVCPSCAEYVHASLRICPACQYEFGAVIRIQGTSSDAEVMTRGEEPPAPVVQIFDVERVTYHVHKRRASSNPPSMRVSYYTTGEIPQKFEEWICLEHEGYARRRAEQWWRERLPPQWADSAPMPTGVAQAMEWASALLIPKQVKVWINSNRPKVVSYVYADGSEGSA